MRCLFWIVSSLNCKTEPCLQLFSDSETTMVTTVEVNESDMDGRFAVTAKTLLDALKEIPEQPLTFEINTDSLEITVQYQNGKYSLMGQNADEFPQSAMLGDNARTCGNGCTSVAGWYQPCRVCYG